MTFRQPTAADLAELPEHNPGPVCRLDLDGTISLANAAARRFLGSDIVGRPWRDVCPGMDDEFWARVLVRRSTPASLEVEFPGACVVFTFVRSTEAEVVFVYGADITERRRAERALAAKVAELAEVARFPDMNPGPVLRVSLDGEVLLANAAAVTVFGASLVGCSWPAVCSCVDQAVWDQVLGTLAIVPVEGRVGDRDFVFAHRRDSESPLVFVFGSDVTLQRRTERALRQAEKMATLGTLAAGVAHELNNPAAATARAAGRLTGAFAGVQAAEVELFARAPDAATRETIRTIDDEARRRARSPQDLDPLARADLEADLETWLDTRGVDPSGVSTSSLVALGLDPDALAALTSRVPDGAFAPLLTWAGRAFEVYALLHEIGQGASRISEIVGALKGYSYVGQAPVQTVNIHEGIDNTLVILQNKLRRGVAVEREYGADVPMLEANGGELNQVWTNLIDNAVDAMAGSGRLVIRTRRETETVVVEIEDNGPGIPPALLSRIFDPFFTTKAPGKGTGLGLSTCHTIVSERHGGSINVSSERGSTIFTVTLPIGARHSGAPVRTDEP